MPKKKTTAEFISDARKVHGDRYDYSKAVYLGNHTKVCIICPDHGEFWQTPSNHISRKTICPKCSREIQADRQRSTTEEFIQKASAVHKGRYDYSKVNYIGLYDKVCIICRTHGEFWQSPNNHLRGAGCPRCSGNHIPTTEEFIASAKRVHGNRYDYSKAEYRKSNSKVCIICPEHGDFWMTPNNHLHGNGCPKCYGNAKIDKEEFLRRAIDRFNGRYSYSKVEWNGYGRKVCIICPDHGEFWQTPFGHLAGHNCPKCSGKFMDTAFFIEKARKVHGDKYDYSKAVFTSSKEQICIICPKHGEFWQKANDHLMGHGCRLCYNEETSTRLTKPAEDFLAIANQVHHNKYDYSLMEYVDRNTPIKIICQKHGVFTQRPKSHIRGAGCPMCNNSVLEETVMRLLKLNGIPFIAQHQFDWLTYNGTLRIDFFLYEQNIAVECQGLQHFRSVDYFGGKEALAEAKKRDKIKKQLCEKHGIKVLYFSNLGIHYPYEVIEDPGILIQAIQSAGKLEHPLWTPDPELPLSYE